ncbi:MAG: A24 family peptidase, partial [Nanoarchaeota archaeon]|nr:A24 family peptidase [Nanoarchaeota archaeon]
MISYVVLSITLFFFTIASIEDFKKKEIYDYINFLYAIIILSLAIIHSLYLNSFDPIKYAGFGLILSFLMGGILYLLGIWGGGDAKFLIGFGASLPYLLEFSSTLVPAQASTFLLNSVSNFMSIIISISTIYIIIINCFVMFLLLLFLTKKRKKQVTLNALTLLVILILLTMGFFFQVD